MGLPWRQAGHPWWVVLNAPAGCGCASTGPDLFTAEFIQFSINHRRQLYCVASATLYPTPPATVPRTEAAGEDLVLGITCWNTATERSSPAASAGPTAPSRFGTTAAPGTWRCTTPARSAGSYGASRSPATAFIYHDITARQGSAVTELWRRVGRGFSGRGRFRCVPRTGRGRFRRPPRLGLVSRRAGSVRPPSSWPRRTQR